MGQACDTGTQGDCERWDKVAVVELGFLLMCECPPMKAEDQQSSAEQGGSPPATARTLNEDLCS